MPAGGTDHLSLPLGGAEGGEHGLINAIVGLVSGGRVPQIEGVLDDSDHAGMNLVVELKRRAEAEPVLSRLRTLILRLNLRLFPLFLGSRRRFARTAGTSSPTRKPGSYLLHVSAVDAAGNRATSKTTRFTLAR